MLSARSPDTVTQVRDDGDLGQGDGHGNSNQGSSKSHACDGHLNGVGEETVFKEHVVVLSLLGTPGSQEHHVERSIGRRE